METMSIIAEFLALSTFIISYQMKKRKHIILVNGCASVLYVLCYLLKGSLDGAVIDMISTGSAIAAGKKNKKFIAKHITFFLVIINLLLFLTGIVAYKNIFTFCAVFGAMLQTSALWITDEKKIRIMSMIGSLFWIVFNITVAAYGLAFGTFLSIVSIGTAIVRYDILPKRNKN